MEVAVKLFEHLRLACSLILIAFGVGFACLPDAWIESMLGFSPDGGNDVVEILISALPITLGLAIGVQYLRRRRLKAATI
jgi:hypothetical protein